MRLPRDKEIITFCKISLRGYEAQTILDGAGYKDVKFMDGGIDAWPYEVMFGGLSANPSVDEILNGTRSLIGFDSYVRRLCRFV